MEQRLESPPRRARRPPTPFVVAVLLGINVAVYLAWQLSRAQPELLQLLVNNFMVSTSRLSSGRVWTLLTAAFSHFELWHLALNMLVLWSFGGEMERLLGRRVFVTFYLVAAVFSSVSHCFVSSVLLGRGDVAALGASGAVSGLLLLFALIFPRHRILIFGIVPVPALVGALGFVGLDVWGLFAQSGGGGLPIGHGAHLGGSLCGALMYMMYVRPRLAAMRSERASANGSVTVALSPEEAADFERIRLKLSHHGPASLTPKEKEFLRQIRERVVARD